jgi:hypothetical protein
MKNFPNIEPKNLTDIQEILRYIQKERRNDINDFNNLNKVFISGRKVGKIPTGASDIQDTDKIGDFNFDADYLYICVDNSGAEWRRATLSTW